MRAGKTEEGIQSLDGWRREVMGGEILPDIFRKNHCSTQQPPKSDVHLLGDKLGMLACV